jgi:hypothetical protein
VSGDNENWVNQRLTDINIDIVALKGLITAKTWETPAIKAMVKQ